MQTIGEWLASIGLSEYTQRFDENYIDPSVLPDLTDQDLKDLGVPLGHRKKMLRAIAELRRASARKLQTAAEPAGREYAERRQLSVMFCDLVGSTALSARLDPEDMRQVLGLFHGRIAEVINGYQGTVARYMGDVIRRRMRMTPSKLCAPGSRSSMPYLICRRAGMAPCRSGSALQLAS